MKSAKHAKLGSAAAVLFALAIASAGLGCESILGLTAGKGLCEGVTCPAKDACHFPGTCDKDTGQCSNPVAMDDKASCDDGDPCTTGDTCQGGACMPGAPKMCEPQNICQSEGICNPTTGMCSYIGLSVLGDCAEADECSSSSRCEDGICVLVPRAGAEGYPCNLGDTCTQAGTCTNGKCTGGKVLEDGALCNDGSVCTLVDKCTSGVCNPSGDHSWARWDLEAAITSPRYEKTTTVVFDKVTHLTWERDPPKVNITWDDAKAYCENLSIPSYPKGWRLPTRIELASIVDYNRSAPAIDTGFFVGQAAHYWTSSPRPDLPDQFWKISFIHGYVGTDVRTAFNNLRVRCVR